jgi:hypothetical protein
MTLVLIFCIVFITGCSKSGSTKLTNTINELKFENIKSAVRDKVTNLPDGSTERAKLDIPNEVTIIINSNEKPIRILSPEIRKLIDSGYKDTF